MFFSAFLIHATCILAQDPFGTKIHAAFQNVNKTQAPTHYIKEYGYPS